MNGKMHQAKTRVLATLMAAATALGVASCGGGGGGSLAGIDRLGVSSGTVTGFGSVFVNGVEWSTSGATITVDDSPGNESDLRVGQVVTVRGTINGNGTSGQADSVSFDNAIEGPVASINLSAGTFVVLGQTVIVNADTQFDDSVPDRVADGQRQLNDLLAGDIAEVSGYRDSTGAIRATRIDTRAPGGEFEVRGKVSALTATTFVVNGLTVDYSAASLEDFGTHVLANGDVVEAEGTLSGAVLDATRLQLEDSLEGSEGDDSEVEGYITRFVSAADFDVAGVRVTTDAGTRYEGGSSASLALNVKVEVEGLLNAAGVVVADKVKIRVQPDDATVELVGDVASVNASTGVVTLADMNVVIQVNSATRLEDKSAADLEFFSLANLQPGDHIEVIGAEVTSTGAPNDMIATRLERENADDEVIVQGPVQAINEPDLSILGVQVATDFAIFLGPDENEISEAEFFGLVGTGTVVKARTTSDQVLGNALVADEAQIEEAD